MAPFGPDPADAADGRAEARSRPSLPSPLEEEGGALAPGEGQSSTVNLRHKEWRTPLTPKLRQRARSMRTAPTAAEAGLWGILRDRRLADFKFRRQIPIGRYIVDFFCPAARLIVELDGSQHADSTYDAARDGWLRAQGYRILRVWNNDLTDNRDGVLTAIWHALQPPPHPPFGHPLPQGERDDVAPFGQRDAAGGRSEARFRLSNPSPLEGEGGASAPGEGKDSKGQHP